MFERMLFTILSVQGLTSVLRFNKRLEVRLEISIGAGIQVEPRMDPFHRNHDLQPKNTNIKKETDNNTFYPNNSSVRYPSIPPGSNQASDPSFALPP